MWSNFLFFPFEETETQRGFPACLKLLQNIIGLPRVKRSRSCGNGEDKVGKEGTERGIRGHSCPSLEHHPPEERNMKPNTKIYIWEHQVFRR